jgi:HEAT repeat protein
MYSVSLWSLLILGSTGQPSEIDRLIQQLGSPRFAERQAATKRLEAIGEPAALALRKAATTTPDAEVRRRAESLLAGMKQKDGIPEGKNVAEWVKLLGDNDSRARQKAVEALRQLGSGARTALPALEKAMQDKEPAVRWRAAHSLWQVDSRRAHDAMKVILAVSETWLDQLPNLPAGGAVDETQAMLAATMEIVDGKSRPTSPAQK